MKVKSLSHVRLLATHRQKPTRLLHPWDFPGKSTGVGCHCLLQTTQSSLVQSGPWATLLLHDSCALDPALSLERVRETRQRQKRLKNPSLTYSHQSYTKKEEELELYFAQRPRDLGSCPVTITHVVCDPHPLSGPQFPHLQPITVSPQSTSSIKCSRNELWESH